MQLFSNLQSLALLRNPTACRYMESKDVRFKAFHIVLENISKKLLSGVGAVKKQAKIVTDEEEAKLWDKGIIGTHSPITLSNAVFIYCGIYLCLRGGDEHRALKLSQFEFKTVPDPSDSSKMIKCVVYTEHGSKNRLSVVHQLHLQNKIVRHYEIHLLERSVLFA